VFKVLYVCCLTVSSDCVRLETISLGTHSAKHARCDASGRVINYSYSSVASVSSSADNYLFQYA
jgi:hypothetical protein